MREEYRTGLVRGLGTAAVGGGAMDGRAVAAHVLDRGGKYGNTAVEAFAQPEYSEDCMGDHEDNVSSWR